MFARALGAVEGGRAEFDGSLTVGEAADRVECADVAEPFAQVIAIGRVDEPDDGAIDGSVVGLVNNKVDRGRTSVVELEADVLSDHWFRSVGVPAQDQPFEVVRVGEGQHDPGVTAEQGLGGTAEESKGRSTGLDDAVVRDDQEDVACCGVEDHAPPTGPSVQVHGANGRHDQSGCAGRHSTNQDADSGGAGVEVEHGGCGDG